MQNIHFFNVLPRVLSIKTEEITSDPHAFKCILDLYIDYRANPRTKQHPCAQCRDVTRFSSEYTRTGRNESGLLIVMMMCAGISFSLAVMDPAIIHWLSWAGGRLYPVAGAEDRYQPDLER